MAEPAEVALKKNVLSLLLRFLDDILARAGKWTPWAPPKIARANTTYLKSDPAHDIIFGKKNVNNAQVEPATNKTLSAPNLEGNRWIHDNLK